MPLNQDGHIMVQDRIELMMAGMGGLKRVKEGATK